MKKPVLVCTYMQSMQPWSDHIRSMNDTDVVVIDLVVFDDLNVKELWMTF